MGQPDNVADIEVEIDLDEEDWSEADEGKSGVQRIRSLAEPDVSEDEVTHMADLRKLARTFDMMAVPRRIRVEMMSFPLPGDAWAILRLTDGHRSLEAIRVMSGLEEDRFIEMTHILVLQGIIAVS